MAGTNNTNTLYDTVEYIKANSMIQRNVDSDFLRPFIPLAMDLWILPICGTALYVNLQTMIQNQSLSGDYLTLFTVYIQPVVSYFVQAEAIMFSNNQWTNKGIQVKKSDYSDAPKPEDVQRLQKILFDYGAYYAQRCSNYLRANINSFPDYLNAGTGIDTIFPNSTSYQNSIFIPRRLRAGLLDDATGDYGYGFQYYLHK